VSEFPPDRFNEENARKAFRAVAAHQDFDIIRWALLMRLAETRHFLLPNTDGGVLNRAVGKAEEIEWVLACFGESPYGGLPLADGIPFGRDAAQEAGPTPEIGGGYPGGAGSRPPL
jgi:hypothetical protein